MSEITSDPSASSTIAADIQAIARIGAVPTLLKVLCETTGMGFAAVARVTDTSWTACAVEDTIGFGLTPGGQLDVHTTLCKESRAARQVIVIDQASLDPIYSTHHTPRLYGIESYISVPIITPDGEYFGNLCAIDPRPTKVSEPRIVAMFTRFAELIANQLRADAQSLLTHNALLSERSTGELRERFIAILGHDLRSPLAAVSSGAEVLLRRSDDPVLVRDMAGRIKNNIQRMVALVNDTLDLARTRLGHGLGVEMQVVHDINSKLDAVAREIRDANPGCEIDSFVDVTSLVRGDIGRLQQVAANLLGNAVAHGSADAPVRFSAFSRGNELIIEVWNAGPAIAADDLPKLFTPFWRQDAQSSHDGLGLGLHICAEIVKAHGGRISVSSSDEDGTSFTATIPLG